MWYTLRMPVQKDTITPTLIGSILGLILIVVAIEQVLLPVIDVSNLPKDGDTCQGEPIYVDYEYGGAMMDPHECAPQCGDQIWRYIHYSNDVGTQCQKLPGCSDWGEDSGVTCVPPKD